MSEKILHWLKQPFVWIIVAVVVLGGLALLVLGLDPNLGGVLARLLGKDSPSKDPLEIANTVPENRKDEAGNPIPTGVADAHGFTQWEVLPLEEAKGLFRDKGVVTVKDSGGKEHKIKLPVGVRDSDVDSVIEVKPEVFVVKVRDDSKVKVGDLLERLP